MCLIVSSIMTTYLQQLMLPCSAAGAGQGSRPLGNAVRTLRSERLFCEILWWLLILWWLFLLLILWLLISLYQYIYREREREREREISIHIHIYIYIYCLLPIAYCLLIAYPPQFLQIPNLVHQDVFCWCEQRQSSRQVLDLPKSRGIREYALGNRPYIHTYIYVYTYIYIYIYVLIYVMYIYYIYEFICIYIYIFIISISISISICIHICIDIQYPISNMETYPWGIHPSPHPTQCAPPLVPVCGGPSMACGWVGWIPYGYISILDIGLWISIHIDMLRTTQPPLALGYFFFFT